jgi:predicted transposase YbfD/YdcC
VQDPLVLVSAWAETSRLVLSQVGVAPASNEITAVPTLLELLALDGCIVTLDALDCQTATAQAILDREADYGLALKRNRPLTHDAVETYFSDAVDTRWRSIVQAHRSMEDVEQGRLETRHYWISTDPTLLTYLSTIQPWPGLRGVGMVSRERCTATGRSWETSYDLTGLAGDVATFARTGAATGASSMVNTGSLISPFGRLTTASARDTVPRTWRCSVGSSSTCSGTNARHSRRQDQAAHGRLG